MRIQNLKYIVFPLALLMAVACREDDTDGIDTAIRATLVPEPETFAADGRTETGEDSFVAVVVLNAGTRASNLGWTPEVESGIDWATVSNTTVSSDFYETWTGAVTTVSQKGVEVKLEPNTGYRRHFNLLIRVADGTVLPFEIMQVGEKADAVVTVNGSKEIEFIAGGESQEILYTTNMGDVYGFAVEYGEISSGWLTWTATESGKVTLTASKWEDKTTSRTATFTIIVGSDNTSKATVDISVTQLADDDYYYMYGPSCDGLPIAQSIQLTKGNVGVYSGSAYFMASEGGKNPVLINLDSRTLAYPCYCLKDDGTLGEVASAAATLPAGPVIDIDGRRNIIVNFNDYTWSWMRITTRNSMPDSEVSNYKTKSFVARDGSMKTWMVEYVRWDGGDIHPKLGSLMVPTATGAGTDGTGGYVAANFPSSWDAPTLNMAWETTEIGGQLAGTSEKGRIYQFDEMVTGTPRYGIGYVRNEPLPTGWTAGSTIVDAIGRSHTVEYLPPGTSFTGDNAADETAHSMLSMQVQGICPYGWHVANAADWLDIAWAACQASKTSATYKMQEDQVTYKQFSTNSGSVSSGQVVSPRGIGNFAAWLRNSGWPGGTVADGADDFGFEYYPLGFRYMTQGYQCAGTRTQVWIPLCFNATSAYRINVILNNTQTYVELINFDNGQPTVPFRCVKNYR